MKMQAKDSGQTMLTVKQMKDTIENLPDGAVLTIVAGADGQAGHYLIEAEWDPADTKVTHLKEEDFWAVVQRIQDAQKRDVTEGPGFPDSGVDD